MKQQRRGERYLWRIAPAVLTILAAVGCNTSAPPTPEVSVPSLSPQQLMICEGPSKPAAPPGRLEMTLAGELSQVSCRYDYTVENPSRTPVRHKYLVTVVFKNETTSHAFTQPLTFLRNNQRSRNVSSSVEPTVTAEDLGGDGVLVPGERTRELTFEIVSANPSPVLYALQATAQVLPAPLAGAELSDDISTGSLTLRGGVAGVPVIESFTASLAVGFAQEADGGFVGLAEITLEDEVDGGFSWFRDLGGSNTDGVVQMPLSFNPCDEEIDLVLTGTINPATRITFAGISVSTHCDGRLVTLSLDSFTLER